MLIGLSRTSTTDQQAGLEGQVTELTAYGDEPANIYTEQASAVGARPQLDLVMKMLRKDDKLVVTKLDRLARNVVHLGQLVEQIESKGAGLVILSMGNQQLDTTSATGKLILNMMVSVASFERENMLERQRIGVKRAKAQGLYKGRVPTAIKQADKVKALVEAGVQRAVVMAQLSISKASYYRCLKV